MQQLYAFEDAFKNILKQKNIWPHQPFKIQFSGQYLMTSGKIDPFLPLW